MRDTPVQKLEYPRPHPGYYTMAGLRVSRRNLCGAAESYATIYDEFSTFARIFERSSTFRVRPPEVPRRYFMMRGVRLFLTGTS